MQTRKAILIGATGLVGTEILKLLLDDPRFSSVLVFARRSTGVQHVKLVERIVDFRKLADWKSEIQGDVAFSALGTTKAQAGSIEAQYEIDFTYQAEFARACSENGVESFVLISSMGADSRSRIPYSRMKGELDEFVRTLNFIRTRILRPGPLAGVRERRRLSEEVLGPVVKLVSWLPGLGDLHPVSGQQVARRAVDVSFGSAGYEILSPSEVRGSAG